MRRQKLAAIRFPERFSARLFPLVLAAALSLAVPAAARAASLAEMAGQMVLVGFKGNSLDDATIKTLIGEIQQGQIGGVMYLKANVKTLAEVRKMNAAFLAANPAMPPFISLDQEGGKIERLTGAVGFPDMPSEQDIGRSDTPAQAQAIYGKTARALKDEGFNLNFGPVVDLNVNPDNPIIGHYVRSFGVDPDRDSALAAAFIAAHHAAGVLTALKHFPGHGSSTADSHKGFVDITGTWKPVELEPYEKLFKASDPDFVMVGHLYNAHYPIPGDKLELPASLSPVWIGDVLRGKSGELPDLVHTHPSETVAEAIHILREYGVSQMPVVRAEPPIVAAEVAGSVSERTLLDALFAGEARLTDPVEEHMSAPLPSIGSTEDAQAAVALLGSSDAVLVHEDGKPVGVLTRGDLLGFLSS